MLQKVQKIDFLALIVEDIPQATEFYRDTLGFTVDGEKSVPNAYTQFQLEGDTIFALMAAFPEEGINAGFDAALVVDDADACYAAWQANGVELLTEPSDMPFGRAFLFCTPDGHVLRAYQPLAQPSAD